MRKLLFFALGLFLAAPLFAFALTAVSTVGQGGTGRSTFTASQLIYGNGVKALSSVATTTASCSGSASCSPFTIIGSSPVTISASGGTGSSGTVSTSTNETAGFLSYWTSNSATPALLGKVATGTISNGTNITVTNGGAASIIGTGITINLSGQVSTANGGTGLSNPGSLSTAALLLFNGSGGASTLQPATDGTVLQSTGSGSTFTAAALNLATAASITGLLPVTNGGTGSSTLVKGAVLYGGGNGTSYQAEATGTVTCSGTASCGAGSYVLGSSLTITGSGSGGGSGTVSTSTNEVAGRLSYFTSNSGTPALLGQVATSTLSTAGPINITGAHGFLVGGSNATINCSVAGTSQDGCLAQADFTTFNNKQNALTTPTFPIILSGTTISFGGLSTSTAAVVGNLPYFSGVNTFANVATTTLSGSGSITVTAGAVVIGASPISVTCASCTTAVSVATANGFAGSSSGGTTPALTLTTSITGLLKGNGTAIAAAAYTDFPTISANSLLANITGSAAAPASLATSSIFTWSAGFSQTSASIAQIEHHSFTYATSTAFTGTTTIPLETGYGETWNSIQCYTDAGTLNTQVGYGTASTTMLNASTTIGTVSYASNNVMTAGNKVKVDIGTPASSPTKITCTEKDTN